MTVRIVTDSTCDLSAETVASLGLTVVPLTVTFGEREYLDGVDLDAPAFYELLRSAKELPRTSQPSVERFRAAYQRLATETSEILSIHVSSRMSGTLNSASLAREMLAESGVQIELVDSRMVSLALGAVAVEAALAARDGASLAQVAEVARRASGRVGVVALLDTLDYLRRGGRIGRAQSLLGSLLSIKPILHVDDGELAPLERVRTRAKAIERLEQLATADPTIERLYVAAADDDAAAHAFIERVRPKLPNTSIEFGRIGPIVGTHSGPGLLGFCPLRRA